ncbi:hypothetical protein ACE103_03175 [Bradyrhizobium sp. ma5]|uniref:hypothetical protein n=1 Tax=Bradyrhizobium sp. ma5 TaxID=3344828 RepID=UPI0035D43B1D
MSGELDMHGDLIDPAERYQDFMLQIYDLWALAEKYGYSKDARGILDQARLSFMEEYEARHPGFGKGRAIWR